MTESKSPSFTPMKLTNAELTEIDDFIESDDWWFEQKMDGARALAVVADGIISWRSSSGAPLKFAAAVQHLDKINAELLALVGRGTAIFDGEIIVETGVYHVFDLPAFGGWGMFNGYTSDQDAPYSHRRATLSRVLGGSYPSAQVTTTPIARSMPEKRRLWVAAQAQGVEGVVAKRADAAYQWGVRSKNQIKFKLVKSADVFVAERRAKPNSAVLAVNVLGVPTVIGSCSMIGKGDVKEGDVLEVEYLYWTGEAMIQPRMMRKRRPEEKRPVDCDLLQFPSYSREVIAL